MLSDNLKMIEINQLLLTESSFFLWKFVNNVIQALLISHAQYHQNSWQRWMGFPWPAHWTCYSKGQCKRTQQVTTLLCVVVRVFSEQCCVCLHGLNVWLVSNLRNKCQHCCGSRQTEATCWAQQCCVLLANNVASVCMRLKGPLLERGSEKNWLVNCYQSNLYF